MQFLMSYSFVFEADIAMSAVTHLTGALIFSIGDFVLQLVREDIAELQLVAIFKKGSEWVSHIQGGLLFVFTYLQLEVKSAYISCGEHKVLFRDQSKDVWEQKAK